MFLNNMAPCFTKKNLFIWATTEKNTFVKCCFNSKTYFLILPIYAYSVVGFSASSLTFLTGKSVFLDFPVAFVLGVARTFAETALTFIAYFIIGRTRKTGYNLNGGATWHSGARLLEFASKNLCHFLLFIFVTILGYKVTGCCL